MKQKTIKMCEEQQNHSINENLAIIKRISKLKARIQKNIKSKGETENE